MQEGETLFSEERLKQIDEAFDFMRSSWEIFMRDIRREIVKKCKQCKIFQDDLVKANVMSELPQIIMKNWTEHFQKVHLDV